MAHDPNDRRRGRTSRIIWIIVIIIVLALLIWWLFAESLGFGTANEEVETGTIEAGETLGEGVDGTVGGTVVEDDAGVVETEEFGTGDGVVVEDEVVEPEVAPLNDGEVGPGLEEGTGIETETEEIAPPLPEGEGGAEEGTELAPPLPEGEAEIAPEEGIEVAPPLPDDEAAPAEGEGIAPPLEDEGVVAE